MGPRLRALLTTAMLLAALGVGLAPPVPTGASCAVRAPAELAAGADTIFRGKVTAVGPGAPTRAIQRATFLVDTGWKGAVASQMTILNSPSGSISGHIELERGQVYLVFARQGPEGLGTDACLGTRHPDHAAEALAFLGPGTPIGDPVAPDPVPPPPASDRWVPVAPLNTPRAGHTATPLADGRILVAGGDTATAEIYDTEAGRWTVVAPMGRKRSGHSATRLPDGRVLVAGGGPPIDDTPLSAEVYDPAADGWTPAAAMGARRLGHTATALPDGRVLVIGGAIPGNAPEAEIYDPAADRWAVVASPRTVRDGHTVTLLLDGTVLVAGGYTDDGATASAERYDPATDRWRPAGALLTGRRDHAATLLPTGEVLVLGGAGADRAALTSAERYDPATDAWVAAAPLATARIWPTATLLSAYGGQVLVTGGGDGQGAITASAERYDPAGNRWFPLPTMGTARLRHTATYLPLKPTGGILVVGGVAPGGVTTASAESLALGELPHVCSPGPPRTCLRVRFQRYWWENGGLARFGLPLGDERVETLEDGKEYTVQYFERARFELHPANAAPYDVQLGQLGRHFHPPDPPAPPLPRARYFPETGHNVSGRFLAYWEANGGLPGFGLPLGEEFVERLENGREYTVQYFERARFEHHPEHPTPHDVLLGQLGRRLFEAR